MLICLLSDVHGNLPALEIVLQKTKDIDLYISLGDVVNYGPWSNECVDLLGGINQKIVLLGNHEENFISKKYRGINTISKTFHEFCITKFSRFSEIKFYQESCTILNYKIIHTIDNQVIFPDSNIALNQNIIIGHSHKQYITCIDGYKIINPGSVGQNRTYINEINYMVWNTEKDQFKKHSIVYNVDLVINKMESMKYPEKCVDYYKNKKRL